MGIPDNWHLFDHSTMGWVLLFVAALIVGFSKTGVAGVGVLNPVLFAMIFPAARSVGFLLPMLIMADVFAVGKYRKDAEWPRVWKSLPWALAGIGLGFIIMHYFKNVGAQYDQMMKITIGVIVLGMMALSLWLAKRSKSGETKIPIWLTPLFGFLTGITTMLANAAGPVFTLYLLAYSLPKKEFMGTRAMAFFILNWIKVPLQWHLGNITAESISLNFCLLPAIAIGAFIGVKTLKMIPEKVFKIIIQILVVASCFKLVWSGIVG